MKCCKIEKVRYRLKILNLYCYCTAEIIVLEGFVNKDPVASGGTNSIFIYILIVKIGCSEVIYSKFLVLQGTSENKRCQLNLTMFSG